jgi:pyridoxal phosphate enzyme (YggS family)
VRLLAVSKTRPADIIRQAYACGIHCFGENYLQEALEKQAQLNDLDIEWHMIGPIQSNKTRQIAESFSWVHGIDREKIALRLNDQRPDTLPPLNVCIQVNIDDEASKSGVSPEEIETLATAIKSLPRLRLRGLMTIPHPQDSLESQRVPLRKLKECFDALNQKGFNLDTLSMGMTDDMEAAILEGSTLVRIGTALFGSRHT